jgi:hypothetical protein
VCVGIAIAFALIVTTGGLRPPLLLQCERLSAKKRFLRCTNARSQERRASARRGCGKLVCVDASALVRLTADGVWGNRHCIRVNRYHGGLTPPALVAVRTFVGEKTIFAMHKRTLTRAAGVSPPWCGKRICGTIRFLFGEQRHQERRASARRGAGNAFATAIAHTARDNRLTTRTGRRKPLRLRRVSVCTGVWRISRISPAKSRNSDRAEFRHLWRISRIIAAPLLGANRTNVGLKTYSGSEGTCSGDAC